jgi:hypothetical protein
VCALIGRREKWEMNLASKRLPNNLDNEAVPFIILTCNINPKMPKSSINPVQCHEQMVLRPLNSVNAGSQWLHLFPCSTVACVCCVSAQYSSSQLQASTQQRQILGDHWMLQTVVNFPDFRFKIATDLHCTRPSIDLL